MHILREKQVVDFDPKNATHVAAIMQVIKGGSAKDLPRFSVMPPYTSVITQALMMMAEVYSENLQEKENDKKNTDLSDINNIVDIRVKRNI